jgi:predicted transcriptional regulator
VNRETIGEKNDKRERQKKLLSALKTHNGCMSKKEIQNEVFNNNLPASILTEILDSMEEEGIVELRTELLKKTSRTLVVLLETESTNSLNTESTNSLNTESTNSLKRGIREFPQAAFGEVVCPVCSYTDYWVGISGHRYCKNCFPPQKGADHSDTGFCRIN